MRQRRVKNRDQILADCGMYLVNNPIECRGKWQSKFDIIRPLYLEIGSGKGQFITELSSLHPENNYLGCEGGKKIYIRVLQKAKMFNLSNFLMIPEYIINPTDFFADNELDGIYLNFSDPWPKKGNANKRLTHIRKLLGYKQIVKPGAKLFFKTDNDDLFEWSLTQLEEAGYQIQLIERDLWNSEYSKDNIPTEYENKFALKGKSINYCVAVIK